MKLLKKEKEKIIRLLFETLIRTEFNWGGRIRTYEWRSQSPQPYHLATPQGKERKSFVLGKKGLEPLTPWFVATCSNPLSYKPKIQLLNDILLES